MSKVSKMCYMNNTHGQLSVSKVSQRMHFWVRRVFRSDDSPHSIKKPETLLASECAKFQALWEWTLRTLRVHRVKHTVVVTLRIWSLSSEQAEWYWSSNISEEPKRSKSRRCWVTALAYIGEICEKKQRTTVSQSVVYYYISRKLHKNAIKHKAFILSADLLLILCLPNIL